MPRSFCLMSNRPPLSLSLLRHPLRPNASVFSTLFARLSISISHFPLRPIVSSLSLSLFRYLQFVAVRHGCARNKGRRLTLRTNQTMSISSITVTCFPLSASSCSEQQQINSHFDINESTCIDCVSYSTTTERRPIDRLPSIFAWSCYAFPLQRTSLCLPSSRLAVLFTRVLVEINFAILRPRKDVP
jgi:hypothetical protein